MELTWDTSYPNWWFLSGSGSVPVPQEETFEFGLAIVSLDYTPVREPGIVTLLGLGLIGFGSARAFRSHRQDPLSASSALPVSREAPPDTSVALASLTPSVSLGTVSCAQWHPIDLCPALTLHICRSSCC